MKPLQLVVVDPTDDVDVTRVLAAYRPFARGAGGRDGRSSEALGLSPIWEAGAKLYEATGRADATCAATSWGDALRFASDTSQRLGRPIGSLQAWGHGGFGFMRLGDTQLDADAIAKRARFGDDIDALRDALAPGALVWLRCCSAFGSEAGRAFASALASRLAARVAAHTHVIGFWQSGAHSLAPGDEPRWSAREGVRFANGAIAGAKSSSPFAPNTVTCLATELPAGF